MWSPLASARHFHSWRVSGCFTFSPPGIVHDPYGLLGGNRPRVVLLRAVVPALLMGAKVRLPHEVAAAAAAPA